MQNLGRVSYATGFDNLREVEQVLKFHSMNQYPLFRNIHCSGKSYPLKIPWMELC